MKGLFITHDTSTYGASRSLSLLLRHYRGAKFDLLVQRPLRGFHDEFPLRAHFGPAVGRIFQAYLPFDACYQYARPGILSALSRKAYNCLLWGRDRTKVADIIDNGGYDFIHLNSLVLHPLISGRHPFILHMRDVYDGSNAQAVQNVQQAAGVIFIDEATRAPFRDIRLKASIILNNPIDMTGVATFAGLEPHREGLDVAHNTVFSVIGVVSEAKGTGFIVRTFLQHRDDRSRLLIVGGRERTAIAAYRRLAKDDNRIIFWGEERDIEKIYAMSDYVLRGEAFPCIGRTVYEGLYAGCRVIVPGDPVSPPPMFEFDQYSKAISFYRPRNTADLLRLFDACGGTKASPRRFRSNINEYIIRFSEFVAAVVGKDQ
jgi:hypothetical protein